MVNEMPNTFRQGYGYRLKLRLYVVADKLLLFSAASFLTETSRGQADAA